MGNFLTQCVSTDERVNKTEKRKTDKRKPKRDDAINNKTPVAQTKNDIPNSATNVNMAEGPIASNRLTPPSRPIDYYYKMDHKYRGIALIFNHETFFDFQMPIRKGTNVDRDRLEHTFTDLGFDVRVYDNQTETQIKNVLQEVADVDHTDNDCLVVIMLSHGELMPFVDYTTGEESNTILSHDLMGYIHARDKKYPLQTIWSYFTDEHCPTLKNKPRLFIIQACQGDKTDDGFTMLGKRSLHRRIESDGIPFEPLKLKPLLPQHDFLVAYATLPGFFSFRNTEKGSWFVQSLCKEINERKPHYDLMKIFTFVNQMVAYDYESNTKDPELDEKKQMPCIMSMLTKLLLFPKKETVYYY